MLFYILSSIKVYLYEADYMGGKVLFLLCAFERDGT